jgi:hypothetical protein
MPTPPALRLSRRRSISEGYGTYHSGVCVEPGCDQQRAKHGFQNGRQRYKRYCSRLTCDERRKAKLRMNACGRCGWKEARCDLHWIIPKGPYTEDNTITLCPNCHRV